MTEIGQGEPLPIWPKKRHNKPTEQSHRIRKHTESPLVGHGTPPPRHPKIKKVSARSFVKLTRLSFTHPRVGDGFDAFWGVCRSLVREEISEQLARRRANQDGWKPCWRR
jgi:hypothetical protein